MPSKDPTPVDAKKRGRFGIYRLCECAECGGRGKVWASGGRGRTDDEGERQRCSLCRGEGRTLQELCDCDSPEAVGVALVTLAREGEFEECPIGVLDREGETNQKWLVRPWLPSARNVSDAGRTLSKSRRA